jgi:uncharacterized membrane protein
MGVIKITLSFCDERKPTVGTLFNFWDCFWRYFGAAILYCLMIFAGSILLFFPKTIWFFAGMLDRVCSVIFLGFPRIVRFLRMPVIGCSLILLGFPGIMWGVKFSLWPYFVIDKGLGPIAALKASSRTTMGVKRDLLGFNILLGLINLAGLLCLILGVFATYPTVIVAHALVYRQLSAQTPELAEWGITQPLAAGDAMNHFAAM